MGRKGKELTTEVKEIVKQLLEEGNTISYIAEVMIIPKSTIGDLKKKICLSGSVENIKRGGRHPRVTERDYRQLERLVKTNRRDSLADITHKFNENRDVPVSK